MFTKRKIKKIWKKMCREKDPLVLKPYLIDLIPRLNAALPELFRQERLVVREYLLAYRRRRGWLRGPKTPTVYRILRLKGLSLYMAGYASLSLEVALAVWISPMVFNLNRYLAMGFGLLVALSFTLITKAIMLGVLFDENNPAPWLERFRITGLVAGILSLVSLVPYIFCRSIPEIALLSGYALGIGGLALPVCSGAFLAAAILENWQQDFANRFANLRELQTELRRLRSYAIYKLRELEKCTKQR